MPIPGVHIETLMNPAAYSTAQLERVCEIAKGVSRGKFILCEQPAKCPRCFGRTETYCTVCGLIADD